MDEQLIIEIWDTFKDYVPEKSRTIVAAHFVDFLTSKDVELTDLEGILGYDPHLDDAIQFVIDENKEEEDDDEENIDDWDYDEDEE